MFVVALLVLASVVAGCSTSEPQAEPPQQGSRVEYSYLSPGADFSRYRGLIFVPLEILHADQTPMAPSEDLLNLRGEFRTAFIEAMNGEYMILTRPSRDLVRVRAQLVNASFSPARSNVGAGLSFDDLAGGGQLLFSMQIEDSYTETVLVRASDRYSLGAARSDEEKQQRIAAAARYWAGLFKEFLDDNLRDARTR
jgi:hypothetical protein